MDPRLNSHLLTMAPYKPGRPIEDVKREFGLSRVIKLASNENPLGPSPKAIEAVAKAAYNMHLYPDGSGHILKEALSNRYNVGQECILLGNGSDELIHLFGLMFLDGPRDEILIGDPSFSRYDASALLAKSAIKRVPLDHNLKHDLLAMADAITEHTKLIYIANPHNPTGSVLLEPELTQFIQRVPSHVILVLDEAYAEFTEGLPGFPDSIKYVQNHSNVIVLRTFSKAYGLAGIRVGYGFADPKIVDGYHRAREPFNVNSLAQAAAAAALGDTEFLARSREQNRKGLAKLNFIFKNSGAKPYESFANFALADFGRPTDPLFQTLLEHGVITRAGSWFGLPNCLRVTVGTDEELEYFEQIMMQIQNPVMSR